MPVARIYASLVEEAEPICADLLARGYNVEVVFPDAVLPTPADLELRVERCSAEQAIARVESGGSSSRCVFMTPSKGPQRELLLVEMTVLATGTDGPHPMAMPFPVALPAPAALPSVHAAQADQRPPSVSVEVDSTNSNLAEVLPFPVLPPEAPVDAGKIVQPVSITGRNLSGHLIAELNAFLAHAPIVERPDGLHVRILESMRNSASVERARKNWEGLTLAAVAASLVVLIALGWYAGPNRSRQVVVAATSPVVRATAPAAPEISSIPVSRKSLKPVGLTMETPDNLSSTPLKLAAQRQHVVRRHRRRLTRIEDNLVAQDEVLNTVRHPAARAFATSSAPATTTSELIQPRAMRSAPIKIITDLK